VSCNLADGSTVGSTESILPAMRIPTSDPG
jgi:hypothetical protein